MRATRHQRPAYGYKPDVLYCIYMYNVAHIVIEDDGDLSCREWKVIGVHNNIRNASIQAWQHVVDEAIRYDFIAEWWYKTDKKHVKERAEFRGIGSNVHIIVWNMTSNQHSGTWCLDKNAAFRTIGGMGKNHFMTSLNNWRSCLHKTNRVPGTLWNEYMRYQG